MANSTIRKEQLRDIPLTVKESDGSPVVYPVDTISLNGATVTDLGGGDVLITVVASGGSGTPLTVMDADGSPVVTNVDTIIFSGAIVTDLGSGDVLVTVSGMVNTTGDDDFVIAMAVAL